MTVDERPKPGEATSRVTRCDGRRATEGRNPIETIREQAFGRGVAQRAIQPDKHWKRGEHWQAPRERVEARLLVQSGLLHLQSLRIVRVHRLKFLNSRLHRLHLHRALHLLLGQRKRRELHQHRQHDDGKPVRVRHPSVQNAIDPLKRGLQPIRNRS